MNVKVRHCHSVLLMFQQSASQNIIKFYLKKFRICLIWVQSDPLWCNYDTSVLQVPVQARATVWWRTPSTLGLARPLVSSPSTLWAILWTLARPATGQPARGHAYWMIKELWRSQSQLGSGSTLRKPGESEQNLVIVGKMKNWGVRFRSKVGQIGLELDNFVTFSDTISVHFGSANWNLI